MSQSPANSLHEAMNRSIRHALCPSSVEHAADVGTATCLRSVSWLASLLEQCIVALATTAAAAVLASGQLHLDSQFSFPSKHHPVLLPIVGSLGSLKNCSSA